MALSCHGFGSIVPYGTAMIDVTIPGKAVARYMANRIAAAYTSKHTTESGGRKDRKASESGFWRSRAGCRRAVSSTWKDPEGERSLWSARFALPRIPSIRAIRSAVLRTDKE